MYVYYSDDCFADSYDRMRFAKIVSNLFPHSSNFDPYKPNEWDDSFWTLDQGNDYKLKFLSDEPNKVELRHRYDNVVSMVAWADLLKVLTGASRVEASEHEKKVLAEGDRTPLPFDDHDQSKVAVLYYRHADTFKSDYARKDFAKTVAEMLPQYDGCLEREVDNETWKLDREGCHQVKFYEGDNQKVAILYSGDQPGRLMALANWIQSRMGSQRIEFFDEEMVQSEEISTRLA